MASSASLQRARTLLQQSPPKLEPAQEELPTGAHWPLMALVGNICMTAGLPLVKMAFAVIAQQLPAAVHVALQMFISVHDHLSLKYTQQPACMHENC